MDLEYYSKVNIIHSIYFVRSLIYLLALLRLCFRFYISLLEICRYIAASDETPRFSDANLVSNYTAMTQMKILIGFDRAAKIINKHDSQCCQLFDIKGKRNYSPSSVSTDLFWHIYVTKRYTSSFSFILETFLRTEPSTL